MKVYYDMAIKPLNEALGESLRIHQIKVTQIPHTVDVPVIVDVLDANGRKVQVKAQNIGFYKSLGLKIWSQYE